MFWVSLYHLVMLLVMLMIQKKNVERLQLLVYICFLITVYI